MTTGETFDALETKAMLLEQARKSFGLVDIVVAGDVPA